MNNKKSKLKVATILGTRPEIIRLSRIISLLDEKLNHILIHTGQNYDFELNEIFFKELGLRTPDYLLKVNTDSLGKVLGETISKSEEVLLKEKPDAVLILGDTNSSLSGIIAKRMKIPLYHMEAGNRCYDHDTPEEINRKIIDHISDYNLVYTEHARRQLLSEGLSHNKIFLTGSPLFEVLNYYKEKINESSILNKLSILQKQYFLVSFHREENVDNIIIIKKIVDSLNYLANKFNLPLIVTTHPRTRNSLEKFKDIIIDERIHFFKPFGFFDYVKLQMNALCVVSDSGTISEESAILSFPAITIRKSIERPEAIDSGTIILTGFEKDTVIDAINLAIEEFNNNIIHKIPIEYLVNNTSWRVIKLIIGTSKLSI